MFSLSKKQTGLIGFFLTLVVLPSEASAQCRIGSGPDIGDGIPYCSEIAAPPTPQAPRQASWHQFAGAVAWAHTDSGYQFVYVSRFYLMEDAGNAVLEKCRRKKGWRNCTLAEAGENGVIVIGKTKDGSLVSRFGSDLEQTKARMVAACAAESEPCKIVKIVDFRPQYY